jgi:hypothetical protein
MDLNMLASTPYLNREHGTSKSIQQIREILQNEAFEITDMSSHGEDDKHAEIIHRIIADKRLGKLLNGHYIRLNNPRKHFSIVPPKPGCNTNAKLDSRTRVVETVTALRAQKQTDPNYKLFDGKNVTCIMATNAGYFDTGDGHCLGNIVTNGNIVQSSTLHNINFATTKNGRFMVGYLGSVEQANTLLQSKTSDQNDTIANMIGGVLWLVRNGESYVDQSLEVEDMNTQRSGPSFATLHASRISIGHDAEGRIIIVEIDGDGNSDKGFDLRTLSHLLIELGVKNAINLDGGGSATVAQGFRSGNTDDIRHSVLNYVSDGCGSLFREEGNSIPSLFMTSSTAGIETLFRCDRAVTTITCMHDLIESNDEPKIPQEFNDQFCPEEYNRLFQMGLLLGAGVSFIGLLNLMFSKYLLLVYVLCKVTKMKIIIVIGACIYSRYILARGEKYDKHRILHSEFDTDSSDSDLRSENLVLTDDEQEPPQQILPNLELREVKV